MANINYSLSLQLVQVLNERGMQIALAESCTGGGLAEQITAVEGSSHCFDRGFIVYSNPAKEALLGVSADTLKNHGAVSEQVVKEMAKGVLEHSNADISLSITGIAGPGGGTPDKPVGTVWFGIADKKGRCEAQMRKLTSGRKHVRSMAIEFSLQWLLDSLK